MCRNVTSSLNNYKSWSAAVCWATVAPVNNATKMHPAVGFNSYSMVFRVTRDYARSGCDSPEKTSRYRTWVRGKLDIYTLRDQISAVIRYTVL